MHLQVVAQPDVDDALDAAIRALQVAAFPRTAAFREHRFFRHRPRAGDLLVLAWEAERLAAEAALYWARATQEAPHASCLALACLGNICSDPRSDLRGAGYASACVRRALDEGRRGGAAHALLFCRRTLLRYYERFGFRTVDNAFRFTRPGGVTVASGHEHGMALALAEGATWPRGSLELDVDDF